MTNPERTAILIDPAKRTVTEVPYDGTSARFKELTGSERMEATPVINAGPGGRLDEEGFYIEGENLFEGYQYDDSILYDGDALFEHFSFFRFPLYPELVAGPVLIAGVDQDGKSCAPGITAADLQKHITWLGMSPA
ncbi:hypothetical protein [Marinobacter salsuginis]|uniref:DUF3846 domain-containing protein n=1 Tax=Marinobacter salsuginis TaxID=418719 RepID=A0A5M3Q2C8_9GAMM|nr:hypothetical protein [Marinobacter salsuginis]GBO89211.1 hypothetical protein MSSD14B_28790 [Marinobacter salsuginis]